MGQITTSTAIFEVPLGDGEERVMETSAGLLLGADGIKSVGSSSMSALEEVQEDRAAVWERTVCKTSRMESDKCFLLYLQERRWSP